MQSALLSAELAEEIGLPREKIILSAKVSQVQDLIAVYTELAKRSDHALHLGLTEAGMGTKGIVASSAAMGILLQQGIGDTIRVSLTPEPGGDRTREVQVAQELLQTMGFRQFVPIVAACPGCGRTTSTVFQELAADDPGRSEEEHAGLARAISRRRRPQGRRHGLHRQRSRRIQARRHRHLAAGHRRDAGRAGLHRRAQGGDAARGGHRGGIPEDGRRLCRGSLRWRPASRRRNSLFRAIRIACGALAALVVATASSARAAQPAADGIERICALIALQADVHGLPRAFFARLIWKESRFDADAVSPAGAEGIAQFMPDTADRRGLADPFDIDQAIPASAAYLADLRQAFGNLGLAAAAYNAGENRVSRWLSSGGFPADRDRRLRARSSSANPSTGSPTPPTRPRSARLEPKTGFDQACRDLPVVMASTVPMSSVNVKPWGIQVAGNFRRAAAISHWERLRGRFPELLSSYDPVVSRVRTPIGRRGIYAVRIGADDRKTADRICAELHSVGGACVVLRNR